MSGEQCFGSRVTLLCRHPDPLADSVKYIPKLIDWAEDGRPINQSSSRFTLTRLNSTASTLSFTVTEEHYGYRAITCTCFLVRNNANRDHEESNVVTMDALGEYMNLLLFQMQLFICSYSHEPFVLIRLYYPYTYICICTSTSLHLLYMYVGSKGNGVNDSTGVQINFFPH